MSLTHTDVQLDKLTINKFETLNDFRAAASAIGENDISIIEEPFNVDWNESDSGSPAYIKNKPVIGDGVLNIRKNGALIGSFSANQSESMDIDIEVSSASALSGLTDVEIDQPQEGQVLKYNSASGMWLNENSDYVEVPDPTSDSGDVRYLKNTESGLSWGSLSKVAETGSYDDLSDKPEIPTQVQSDWNETDSAETSYIKNKPFIVEKLEDLSDVEISSGSTTEQTYFEDAVEDYDGNKYDAVIIGDQVWLAQNLRTTHYVDGTSIPNIGSSSYDQTNGLFYRVNAILNSSSASSDSNPSGIQGISPNGWHIPSVSEWEEMKNYLRTNLPSGTQIGPSLTSETYGGTNLIGFNATADGAFNFTDSSMFQPGSAYYWTTNRENSVQSYIIRILPSGNDIESSYINTILQTHVRCVCDLTATEFRAKMALRGKVLMYNGDVWTDSDIPAQTQSDWSQTTNTAPDFIKNKPVIGDGVLTVQRNGVDTGSFSANQTTDVVININVPVSASEVSALPDTTRYAADVSVSIDPSTFVMSMQLKDQLGSNIGSGSSVDLPLESVVVGGSYDSGTQMVVLTLQNGDTVEFSVADLVYGLQSEITENNKLSADLVKDGVANKVFTTAEQSKLAGIASGAEVNVQSDWAESDSGSDAYVKNKPVIGDGYLTIKRNGSIVGSFSANQTVSMEVDIAVPVSTSELTNNSYFVSDSAYTHTDNNFDDAYKGKLDSIESGAQVNVQSDWNITDSGSDAYINNKPFVPESLGDLSDVDIPQPGSSAQTYFEDAVEDYDGNKYDVVIIGDQVWMAENLRTTHYADGTAIPDGGNNYSNSDPYYYDNSNSNIPISDRGLYYNWSAMVNGELTTETNPSRVQGIAPNGWHVPSFAEWTQLINYVNSQSQYRYNNQNDCIAKSMASQTYWQVSDTAGTPGNDSNSNNATRFGAIPASYFYQGNIDNANAAYFWSTTTSPNSFAYYIRIHYNLMRIGQDDYDKYDAMSVRCVCDLTPAEFREKMALSEGKVLMYDGEKWTDGDIPVQQQSDWSQTDSADTSYIKNKPTIGDGILNIKKNGALIGSFSANQTSSVDIDVSVPVSTSQLTNDTYFVSDSAYTHTDNNFTTEYLTKLETIASGAQVNVQSDWDVTDSGSDAYILNKPTSKLLPDVTSGDNGSILIVSSGQWTVSSVPVADNTLF